MSFARFTVATNPNALECEQCGNKFKLGGIGWAVLLIMIVIAIGLTTAILKCSKGDYSLKSLLLLILLLTATEVPLEYYLWRCAPYEKSDSQGLKNSKLRTTRGVFKESERLSS